MRCCRAYQHRSDHAECVITHPSFTFRLSTSLAMILSALSSSLSSSLPYVLPALLPPLLYPSLNSTLDSSSSGSSAIAESRSRRNSGISRHRSKETFGECFGNERERDRDRFDMTRLLRLTCGLSSFLGRTGDATPGHKRMQPHPTERAGGAGEAERGDAVARGEPGTEEGAAERAKRRYEAGSEWADWRYARSVWVWARVVSRRACSVDRSAGGQF